MASSQTTAIALFSGGLDSTLACRVVAEQGIKVIAVKFVSPFFGYDLLDHEQQYMDEVRKKYGIDLRLVDISKEYLQLLGDPPHGYGKNFNPCVDCKILLLSKAKAMMKELGASFLVTGEVIGQRPMSQRRDTLRIIERESGCENLLVRPLCARLMNATKPELDGLIDRSRLLDFSGRTRAPQMRLAEKFGITDYPSPAGGCILTDPIQAARIKTYYNNHEKIRLADIRLLLVGRQFHLPGGSWLVLGRDERDNNKIISLRQPQDYLLEMESRPGPTGLLRYGSGQDDLELAAGLVVRYGKKVTNTPLNSAVQCDRNGQPSTITVPPLNDDLFHSLIR